MLLFKKDPPGSVIVLFRLSDFAEKSNILNGYIIPGYEVLHSQGRDYIVKDIIEVLKERGVEI